MMINLEHKVGSYCKSTALSNVIRNQNINLNEAMLFGLSGGLDFSYSKPLDFENGQRLISVYGAIMNDFFNLSETLGLIYEVIKPKDNNEYLNIIRKYINLGIPLIATVSLMDYYNSLNKKRVTDNEIVEETELLFEMLNTSIGNHVTTIVNIDERYIYLYENTMNDIQKVEINDFLLASNPKKFSVIHPKNELHIIRVVNNHKIQIDTIVYEAIRQNLSRFLNSTTGYNGISALKNFKNDFHKWPIILKSDENIYGTIKLFSYFCEIASSGLYRRLYSRFLKEAARILNDEELLIYSKSYNFLANQWKKISRMLNNIKEYEKGFINKELIELLNSIVEEEESLALSLYEFALIKLGGI